MTTLESVSPAGTAAGIREAPSSSEYDSRGGCGGVPETAEEAVVEVHDDDPREAQLERSWDLD